MFFCIVNNRILYVFRLYRFEKSWLLGVGPKINVVSNRDQWKNRIQNSCPKFFGIKSVLVLLYCTMRITRSILMLFIDLIFINVIVLFSCWSAFVQECPIDSYDQYLYFYYLDIYNVYDIWDGTNRLFCQPLCLKAYI